MARPTADEILRLLGYDPDPWQVQVIDGNYEKMTGVCPWWDSMRQN